MYISKSVLSHSFVDIHIPKKRKKRKGKKEGNASQLLHSISSLFLLRGSPTTHSPRPS